MKTSLWMVVVLVAGIVGFLVGYSVSSHTGGRAQEAIEAAVYQPSRYITDRFLPDKAIDLVDEAASRLRMQAVKSAPRRTRTTPEP